MIILDIPCPNERIVENIIIIIIAVVTREDIDAGNKFKRIGLFYVSVHHLEAGFRIFFSRCAGSNYFSGPHSHGRLVPFYTFLAPSCRGSSSRSREERKCKGDLVEQKPPLRRGRSVVPRVIRTREKKLAKLNVRPCLGSSKGSKGDTTNSPFLFRPFFLRVHFHRIRTICH